MFAVGAMVEQVGKWYLISLQRQLQAYHRVACSCQNYDTDLPARTRLLISRVSYN